MFNVGITNTSGNTVVYTEMAGIFGGSQPTNNSTDNTCPVYNLNVFNSYFNGRANASRLVNQWLRQLLLDRDRG